LAIPEVLFDFSIGQNLFASIAGMGALQMEVV